MWDHSIIAAGTFWISGVVLFALQLASQELGYILGRRKAAINEAPSEGVGVVVTGLLGLLAFVLALSLSLASTTFLERRAGSLAESNAIGTAWLRAQAIPGSAAHEIARLLEEYTRVRIAYVEGEDNPEQLGALNRQTSALQSAMWQEMTRIAGERSDPVAALLMSALNDAFDTATATRFAHSWFVPPQVFWLLIGMALVGTAALGYQLGLTGKKVRLLIVLLTATWTIVILNILDLASPRFGGIRSSAEVYRWTQDGFGSNKSSSDPAGSGRVH